MKFNNKVIPYILLQRTQYFEKTIAVKLFRKFFKLLGYSSNHSSIKAHMLLFSHKIKKRYENDMQDEYESFKNYLPSQLENILDIGAGIGGINILLHEKYKPLNIYLIDKTTIDSDLHYGFEKKGSFYNSLSLSKEFLIKNNIPAKNIFLQEASADSAIHFDTEYDLIISLISWGFHYPVSTYLDSAYKKLKENSKLIMDVRKKTNGLEELRMKFKSVKVIKEYNKYNRIVAVK